jgi:hypothetical protein
MSRIIIILSAGMLAMLVAAGASTIAYKIKKPEAAQQRAVPTGPVDATLTKHLQDVWDEIVYAATIPSLKFAPAVHVNYAETVLPMKDGLLKLKDYPAEMGGSGAVLPE